MELTAFAVFDPRCDRYVNFSSKDPHDHPFLDTLDIRCLRTKQGCRHWVARKGDWFGGAAHFQVVSVNLTVGSITPEDT